MLGQQPFLTTRDLPPVTTDSLDRPASRLRSDKVPHGILFMLGATVMFAGSTALSKWQVGTYSFSEVLLFRSAVSLFVCALLIMPRQWWNQPRPGAALMWCGTCGNGSGDTTSGLPLPVPWLAIAWGFSPRIPHAPRRPRCLQPPDNAGQA